MQKEFKELKKAIHKWVEVNRGNVSFIGSFVSYDFKKRNKKDAIKDDMLIGYGSREEVKIQLEKLNKLLDKNKKSFVN